MIIPTRNRNCGNRPPNPFIMQRLFLLCAIFLAFIACQPGNGDDGKSAQQYCTYIVRNDCPCYRPPIQSTDIVCIPCDSAQTNCPNVVRLSLYCPARPDGTRDTCRLTATRQSTSCTSCPSGGKKLKAGDYSTVVIND